MSALLLLLLLLLPFWALNAALAADMMSAGVHKLSKVRTSSGMFFGRAEDPVVKRVEERVAAWTMLPAGHAEGMQVLQYVVSAVLCRAVLCRAVLGWGGFGGAGVNGVCCGGVAAWIMLPAGHAEGMQVLQYVASAVL